MNVCQKASNRPSSVDFQSLMHEWKAQQQRWLMWPLYPDDKRTPFFFWTSLKRVSKTRLALKVCVNRGCVILKCIWIATTLPLLLGGYTWSCRVILVTHRASRVMFTQNWECIQRAASGRCYSSGATRILWKVSGFLLITDNSFTPVPLSIIICTHTSLAREAAAYRRE